MRYATACLLSIVLAAGVAQAAPGVPQVTVSYADLDITHAAGAKVLLERLTIASHTVCGEQPDARDLTSWQAYRSCARDALSRAVASVHEPLVARLFADPNAAATSEVVADRN